ncbi:hypothetical protein chiPu_0022124, partial [Chiloscyllium punctatum]|nr:hypothetical protein [Chiloscyllium punctatum]
KPYTEEELNSKLTRRVQKAARRQAKQEELKRLHRAQIIQRQLEQVEEKQRQLEERGVAVEKALRGEAGSFLTSPSEVLTFPGHFLPKWYSSHESQQLM